MPRIASNPRRLLFSGSLSVLAGLALLLPTLSAPAIAPTPRVAAGVPTASPEGPYYLQFQHGNQLCASDPSISNWLDQQPCTGAAQRWYREYVATRGDYQYFTIRNGLWHQCMWIENQGSADGARILGAQCPAPGDPIPLSMQFTFIRLQTGTNLYHVCAGWGGCISVLNSWVSPGAHLISWHPLPFSNKAQVINLINLLEPAA